MSRDDLRSAGAVLRTLLASGDVGTAVGHTAAALTTWSFAVFAVLGVVAVAWSRERRRVLVILIVGAVSGLGAAGVGVVVKSLVRERRPCQIDPTAARWTACPTNWSFPSNHAVWAGALAATTVVVAVVVRHLMLAVVGGVVACGIAASRVVLGVHYWWDVLVGVALGAGIAVTALVTIAPRIDASRWFGTTSVGSAR